MSVSKDLLFQYFSTVQDNQQPFPKTLASAADMSTSITGFLTFITGTTAIATIQPPTTGICTIVLVFTDANPGGVTTGGNIMAAVDPAQYAPIIGVYDPVSAKWWFGKLAVG